jgi:outer membrane lipoprotein SlyB
VGAGVVGKKLKIGALVGLRFTLVGASVGVALGANVGDTLGDPVGANVGDPLGAIVGDTDGDPVGANVGDTDGLLVSPGTVGLQIKKATHDIRHELMKNTNTKYIPRSWGQSGT